MKTYTHFTITNTNYLYRVTLENGRVWLSGNGRDWWRAGDSIPDANLCKRADIIEQIRAIMQFRIMPVDVYAVINDIISPRHLQRLPLGASRHYFIRYMDGKITVTEKGYTYGINKKSTKHNKTR